VKNHLLHQFLHRKKATESNTPCGCYGISRTLRTQTNLARSGVREHENLAVSLPTHTLERSLSKALHRCDHSVVARGVIASLHRLQYKQHRQVFPVQQNSVNATPTTKKSRSWELGSWAANERTTNERTHQRTKNSARVKRMNATNERSNATVCMSTDLWALAVSE